MKKSKIILGALLFGSLMLCLNSCKKNAPTINNSGATDNSINQDNPDKQSQRMWYISKQLYAVAHDPVGNAHLFPLSVPVLALGTPTAFYVGSAAVKGVTGIAIYSTSSIIISTGGTSNFPNRLLTYPLGGPYTSPIMVSCVGISDIEFNEYDGVLYGIYLNSEIRKVDPVTGSTSTNLAPPIPAGSTLRGLCNYNALLSYSINDNTAAPDNFYSYNPGIPTITPPLFSTDWGVGDGGMHYCDGYGWEIATSNGLQKLVQGWFPYTASAFSALGGGGQMRIVDLTSN